MVPVSLTRLDKYLRSLVLCAYMRGISLVGHHGTIGQGQGPGNELVFKRDEILIFVSPVLSL